MTDSKTLHPSLMPDEWFHASRDPGIIDRFDPDKDPFARDREESAPKHWNAHMGTHFTSLHHVAQDLATDHGGRVYHATLAMKNPRHYDSEHDMDQEAYDHHITDAGEDFPAYPTPEDALTSHPRARELAHNFKHHLQSQGYDGVTYGNEYEGPKRHTCAIAFHPDDIKVTNHHPFYEEREHLTYLGSKTAADDYRMQHTPAEPEDGAPLHDLTQVYPADVYTHPHYYMTPGEASERHSMNIAHSVRGKPNVRVKIYRAMPPEHAHKGIQTGNWVTLDRGYAVQHGKHATDPKQDWPVVQATVPAKHLFTSGDSIAEWGYHGPSIPSRRKPPAAQYDGPTQGFSFSGGETGASGSGGLHLNAWDPEGAYAGHVRSQDGQITETHVEPQHAETDLAERLTEAHRRFVANPPMSGHGPFAHPSGEVNMKTAADEQGLPNPYHSDDEHHHTWFHGATKMAGDRRAKGMSSELDSPSYYLDEDFAGNGSGHAGPQTNKILGTHFSALRSVAKGFAKDYTNSDVYHARLKMKNPAYFPTEHHLDRYIFRHAMENHPEFGNDEKFASEQRWQGGSTPRQLAEVDRQMGDDDSNGRRTSIDQAMGSIVQWHPKQREIAKSFVKSLRDQGYDGIVYGNMVEGPKFHHSAIAFHPDDIDVQHIAHLPESPKGGDPENPWRRTESPERTADHALDESFDRLGDIQEQHHGSRERFDFEHSTRTNQDHGPWTPYSGKHILTPYKMGTVDKPDVSYHITSDPHFALDPEKETEQNYISTYYPKDTRGIHVTQNPESWVNGHNYVRPYIAEIHSHGIPLHENNVPQGANQRFIPGRDFDKIKVHRVIPLDAHVREQYGAHGWIEEHHGTTFDTGEKIKPPSGSMESHYPFKDFTDFNNAKNTYHYDGPDVRDMSPEEHERHKQRWLGYMKENRGFDDEDIADLSKNSARKPVRYHVAPETARESILQHGLDHGRGLSPWEGGDLPKGNYLFGNIDDAHQYQHERDEYEHDQYGPEAVQHDLWAVHHPGPLEPDPDMGLDGKDAGYTSEPIHPRHLRLIEPVAGHQRQAARKPVRRDPKTGIEMCHKKVDGFPCRFLLGHAQQCDVDWEAAYPDEPAEPDEVTRKPKTSAWVPQGDTATARELGGPSGDHNGRIAGWHEDELQEPHVFTRTMLPVHRLNAERDDHEVTEDPYYNEQVRQAVKDGTVDPVVATTTPYGYSLLDGHHRVRIAHQEGVTHIPAWLHEGGLVAHQHTAAISDQQHTDLADHFTQFHPHLDADNPMADWLHRADHHQRGQRALGPRRAEPMDSHPHPDSIDPYVPSWQRVMGMGAYGPDYTNLRFDTNDDDEPHRPPGSMKIRAIHPQHGEVGYLSFVPKNRDRTADKNEDWTHVEVNNLHTDFDHQRRGVASQMMDHLHESIGDDVDIDHGDRTAEGDQWAHGYFGDDEHPSGKKVQDDWARTAGANGSDYEGLTYDEFGDTQDDSLRTLRAHHPEHGLVGSVYYHQHPQGTLEIKSLDVSREHQRRGVATQMMRELEARNAGVPIDHGNRTQDGADWARSMYGKPGRRQREDNWPRIDEPIYHGGWTLDGKPVLKYHAMGAAGPDYDNLTFTHVPESPRANNTTWTIYAHHPEHREVGQLEYDRMTWPEGKYRHSIKVNYLNVDRKHQRRGVASQLMNNLESRHQGIPIDHGDRTQQGGDWAASHYGDPGGPPQPGSVGYSGGYTLDGKPFDPRKQGAVRNVSDSKSDGDGITEGIMIAIVPPEDLAARLQVEGGEDPAQIHLTLAYLGQTGEYSAQQLGDLQEVVAAWAEAHEPLSATVQGSGTFVKAQEDGQHVLWASVDAPGLERLHVSLVDYLLERGYHPSMNHVFVPHMTLSYERHHVRFLPKVERETWMVGEVWVCIAGRWESVDLGAGVSKAASTDPVTRAIHEHLDRHYPGVDPQRINEGDCLDLAESVVAKVPGAEWKHPSEWGLEDEAPSHHWVEYQGKHYDAEAPHGVADWHDLPVMRREGYPGSRDRTAARGRPRRDQSRPDGGDPATDGQQGDAGPVGDGQGAPRPLSLHPKVEKEMSRLHPQDQQMLRDTMDRLAQGDPRLDTHALHLELQGWYSTKASRGHRIIHRPDGNGGIFVGYAGLHDYDKAINRLTSALERIFAIRA